MLARLKNLLKNVLVYGLGDAATSLVSLLLLPVYTRCLSPADYGVLAMLLSIEAVAKVAFRWGVDTAFMRLYFDCRDDRARQRLASTIFFFLLAANGALVAACVLSSNWFSMLLFRSTYASPLIALTIINTFLGTFFFIPLQILRIGDRAGQFVGFSFARSASTLVLRLILVVGAGMGVRGIVIADIVVTTSLGLVLIRWFAPLIRPVFSRVMLREALAFGLPRVPHSVAQQVISLADRYFLNAWGTLKDVGLYSIGTTFGLAPKYFLSAFEYAWTPFFLGAMKERDAKRIYSTISTYIVAILTLIVVGLCTTAPEIIRIATQARFHAAAAVTPWIALGAMFQGLYLVGSIGLVITKRTMVYPVTTGIAAVASLAANALLIPKFGVMGAAWANAIAYGTLAVGTVGCSLHYYPIRYEWGRLVKLAVAAAVAYVLAVALVPAAVRPWPGFFARGTITTVAFGAVLLLTRFFRAGEWRALKELRSRVAQGKGRPSAPPLPPVSRENGSIPPEDDSML